MTAPTSAPAAWTWPERTFSATSGWATEPDMLRIVRAELPASVTFELHVGSRQIWPPQPDSGGEAEIPVLQVVS